ncbi:unnamed protein product, partial [Thlaspi arvense]
YVLVDAAFKRVRRSIQGKWIYIPPPPYGYCCISYYDESQISCVCILSSSLPNEILQHILCFLPTKFSIRTSLLSKRWKGLWCDTPCISFASCTLMAASRNKTQDHYTAQKMMSLQLRTGQIHSVNHISTWIELAMNRRVESLSLELNFKSGYNYTFPDPFFIQSSLKELSLESRFKTMIVPKVSVSWTSLKKLSLRSCKLSDESLATILSGCPVLESLTLCFCDDLTVVDLSNSPTLRTLEVQRSVDVLTLMQILDSTKLLSTLVDVSSLAEATLNLCFGPSGTGFNGKFLKDTELEMLHNVEKLSFGRQFLELGVPMLKVKDFTFYTKLYEHGFRRPSKSHLDAESKRVATFMEPVFNRIKTLEKVVVWLEDYNLKQERLKRWVRHFLTTTTTMSPYFGLRR